MIMLIEESSSSAWTSAPPVLLRAGESHSRISVAGVIGYAAANRTPPRMAPRPAASFAGDEPAAVALFFRRLDCKAAGTIRCLSHAGFDAFSSGLHDVFALVGKLGADNRHQTFDRQADHAGCQAQSDHILSPAGHFLCQVLHGDLDNRGTGCGNGVGHLAAFGVTNNQAIGLQRHLGGEAVGIVPVDRNQQIVALAHAIHRMIAKTQQCGGFPAANLWSDGPVHDAVEAGFPACSQ